jgi:peptide/nickel transport system permease protein
MTPTLGLMLQTAFNTGALIQGAWWWWAPPTVVLAVLFLGLFLLSMALDEIANPRLRGLRSS